MKLINLGSNNSPEMPRIRFRPSLVDHLLEAAAFLPVLVNWIYILYMYRRSGGELTSDYYESGFTALFLFILLGACGYCSVRFINFPFRVGSHNIVYQYVLALRLVRVMNIILCLMFLFITLSVEHAWADVLGKVCLGLLTIAIAGYWALAFRGR